LVINNYPTDSLQDPRSFEMRPYEARVYRLAGRKPAQSHQDER
jgi:hypothetical protein